MLYLLYRLIDRRNQHFERQARVLYDASYITRQVLTARKAGQLSSEDANNLARIDATINSMRGLETHKSALLWVVLILIPIVDIFAIFYIFYFLTRDFKQHEDNEDYVLSALSYIFPSMGAPPLQTRTKRLSHRSFILYLILDLVTLGIFNIYWFYVLIKDPNQHFVGDAALESELTSSISSLSVPTPQA